MPFLTSKKSTSSPYNAGKSIQSSSSSHGGYSTTESLPTMTLTKAADPVTESLFVFHDPGARNHLWPLYEKTIGDGSRASRAQLVDLRANVGREKDLLEQHMGAEKKKKSQLPKILYAGCSTNRSERQWIRRARSLSIQTVCVIDCGCLSNRLDELTEDETCDAYLVCCTRLQLELQSLFAQQIDTNRVVIRCVGSTYLESLILTSSSDKDRIASRREAVRSALDVEETTVVVGWFASPEELTITPPALAEHILKATDILAEELKRCSRDVFLWIRPHPRSSPALIENLERLFETAGVKGLFDDLDRDGRHDNLAAFSAIDVCLSWSSSAVDCACALPMDGPVRPIIAFLDAGWPGLEQFVMQAHDWATNGAIPRITAAEVRSMLDAHVDRKSAVNGLFSKLLQDGWKEQHLGASKRALSLAEELLCNAHSHVPGMLCE